MRCGQGGSGSVSWRGLGLGGGFKSRGEKASSRRGNKDTACRFQNPRHRPPVLVSRAWSQRPSRRGAFPDLTLGPVPRRMLLGLPLPHFFFFCSKHVSWCEITGPLVRCQDSCQRQPTAPHRAISFPGAQTLSVFVTGAALASGRGFGTREGLSHSSNQLARSFVHSWSCFPPKSEGKRPRPPCQAPERKCEVCSRLFSCLRRV